VTVAVPDELTVVGGVPLRGRLRLPGCKGISHRALLLAALAEGPSRVVGLANGADVVSTVSVLERLGVEIAFPDARSVAVQGHGAAALREPDTVLDCGNSGTTMRMVAGMLAGRPALAVLTGDASLSARPMGRVTRPLQAMGATVDGRADGTLAPLTVRGGGLVGARHVLDVASGQVKTALLLAGLQASGLTEVVEPAPSRDHTERMLVALGAPVERLDRTTVRIGAGTPAPFSIEVPGDPSSAAFFVVAATLVPGSSVVLEDVSLNPDRIGYVDVLRRMGANIDVRETGQRVGEPVGDLAVESSPLTGIEIVGTEAIVDELPVLAVAGAFAHGDTTISGASEMAVKESNRIETIAEILRGLGVAVEPRADGLVVHGGAPQGAPVASRGDHRIAMAAAVGGAAAEGATTIAGWRSVGISYPGFAADLCRLQEPER